VWVENFICGSFLEILRFGIAPDDAKPLSRNSAAFGRRVHHRWVFDALESICASRSN
jgi:hypothetical protein